MGIEPAAIGRSNNDGYQYGSFRGLNCSEPPATPHELAANWQRFGSERQRTTPFLGAYNCLKDVRYSDGRAFLVFIRRRREKGGKIGLRVGPCHEESGFDVVEAAGHGGGRSR